ncbi:MAG: MFS transporter [candidate division WOR-3 bacterium]|jgi:MFS family permease|nr:MFS transporter [candidate division WOR-3 bacterium]MDH7519193.1 MFS transporter [bacterium]
MREGKSNSSISLPATFAAFKHRNFRLYWLGNMVSFIGTWMQNTAKGWLVLSITNSPFFVGLDSTLSWLAVWFVSLPAGVLADRFNKRNLMIVTQSALALFALLLTLLTWFRIITITHILLISGFAGIFVALNAPVAQTLVPDLVERKDVLNAIALNSSMFNLARMIGPALAGSILTFSGPAVCFGLNALSFLAIIIALLFIKINTPPPPQSNEPFLRRVGFGLKFVKSHPDIRLLMIMTGIFSSFGICYIPLMPVIARDVLHLGARGYGFLMSALGAGALTGGLTLATLSRTRHRGKILITGTCLLGILLLALSFVRNTNIALTLFVFIGFCQTSVAALTNTLIQTLSPDYVRGRAMSVFNIFFNGMFPVGSLIAGTLAQTKGAPFALFISGVVVLITLFTATAIRPQLHRL